MDSTNEVRNAEEPEYIPPTIVDYGDLVELTALHGHTGMQDVPHRTDVS